MSQMLSVWFNVIQKSTAVKVYGPQEGHCEKYKKSEVAAKKWLDGRPMAKFLMMTIQVNLCCLVHIFARIWLASTQN